jgi:hypothetical protein
MVNGVIVVIHQLKALLLQLPVQLDIIVLLV